MSELQLILDFFQKQPILAYSLLASLILAVVPLVTGLARLDILGALSPQGLLSIVLASGLAWLIYAQGFQVPLDIFQSDAFLLGLSRFPLYVVALAYGSSAGLLSGGLFLAFGFGDLQTDLWLKLILLLELAVVGWFALSPSPRRSRFAGPFGAFIAYVLTWVTAGVAFLEATQQAGSSLAAHLSLHEGAILGAGIAWVLLLFISPAIYQRLFPYSRIVPPDKPITPPKRASTGPKPGASTDRSRPSQTRVRSISPLSSGVDLPALSNTRARHHTPLPTLRALPDASKRSDKRELPSISIKELD